MENERPRSYRIDPSPGYADQWVAWANAALDESAERLIDIIGRFDVPELHRVPAELADPNRFSMARLVKHIAWGELNWIRRLTSDAPPASLAERCRDGALEKFGDVPEGAESATELCDLVAEARSYSGRVLRSIVDHALDSRSGPKTVREVLVHLLWHWTYHTGQVGLMGDMAGHDYTWRFESDDS